MTPKNVRVQSSRVQLSVFNRRVFNRSVFNRRCSIVACSIVAVFNRRVFNRRCSMVGVQSSRVQLTGHRAFPCALRQRPRALPDRILPIRYGKMGPWKTMTIWQSSNTLTHIYQGQHQG